MSRSATAPAPGGRESIAIWVVYGSGVFGGVFEAISLYATLAGQRPTGAYLGFVVFLGIAVAGSTLVPDGRTRRCLLARGAILLSLVALTGTILIPARIADAQGALPSGIRVAQAALFVLFQLGWAATRWLTIERRATGEARHIPAAAGTVLLLVGGFMLGRVEEATPADAAPTEGSIVFDQFSDTEDLAFATETATAGEPGPVVFAHYHSGEQPLLGLSFSTRDWFSRERIGDDLRGVFERDAEREGTFVVIAPEGFIVAAIEVQAEEYISALRVRFAPYDGTFVSPFDRTWSEWYGGYRRGEVATSLDGESRPIVGLRGSGGMVLSSLSLLIAK